MAVEIHNILVPIDGSAHSTKAAGYAATFAEALDATVTLLIVHSKELRALEGTASLTDADHHTLSHKEVEKIAHERYALPAFEAASKVLGTKLEKIHKLEVWGNAAEQICQYADKHHIDLIVMGSRGMGQIKSLVLGSVSYEVMRRARAPVLVIR